MDYVNKKPEEISAERAIMCHKGCKIYTKLHIDFVTKYQNHNNYTNCREAKIVNIFDK
jgi:hypothetical protein